MMIRAKNTVQKYKWITVDIRYELYQELKKEFEAKRDKEWTRYPSLKAYINDLLEHRGKL